MSRIKPAEAVVHARRFLNAALDDRRCKEPSAFEPATGGMVTLYFGYLVVLIETAERALKPRRVRK